MREFYPPHSEETLRSLEFLQKCGKTLYCRENNAHDSFTAIRLGGVVSYKAWTDPTWSTYVLAIDD